MARPTKYVVEYFPHYCQHGKTMFIIESRYGNNGYAFWFKLLETLGAARGHYLTLTNPLDIEFLGAKTRLSVVETTALLNLLAELESIDKNLWEKKIVWSQHLVENLDEVYANRKGLTPDKPYFKDDILHQNIDNHHINSINIPINTQSRVEEVKETRVKERKEEIIATQINSIKDAILTDFKDIDTENEIKKCIDWWAGSKKVLKNPKLALRNWMTNARKYKQEHEGHGKLGANEGHIKHQADVKIIR